jgi:galactokinase
MREVQANAPGRVNLIGEHTDYHEGYVLPCAVPQRTFVTLRVRADKTVHLETEDLPGPPIEYTLGEETPGRGWADYVQGVTTALARAGVGVGGFDLRVRSDVPLGSGLSSSAALEVAVLRALRAAFDLAIGDVDIARLGQRAEVDFVGAPVGIMDQMASSLAAEREALFLDTRTLVYQRIPLPHTLDLVVISSGLAHKNADAAAIGDTGANYATRRRQSEEAAQLLGVRCLRDAGLDDLPRLASLPDVLARRARHVITENARVLAACDALRAGDLPELGRLFVASHVSMRDDYEVSIPEIDRMVQIANTDADVYGARLTGGGFGGSIVIAAAAGTAGDVASRVIDAYAVDAPVAPIVLIPPPVFHP